MRKVRNFSGQGIDKLLEIDPPNQEGAYRKQAFEALALQVQQHVESPVLDLNQLFVDVCLLKWLVIPIVTNVQSEMDEADHKDTTEKLRALQARLVSFEKKLNDLKRIQFKGMEDFQSLLAAFKKTVNCLINDWTEYQNRLRNANPQQTETDFSDEAIKSSAQHKSMAFNLTRNWTLVYAAETLAGEIENRLVQIEGANEVQFPNLFMIPKLVAQLRSIHLTTDGFELLEKVKLIRARNQQLAEELQDITGEKNILARKPQQLVTDQKPLPKTENKLKLHIAPKPKPKPKANRNLLLIIGGILAVLILLVMFQQAPDIESERKKQDGYFFPELAEAEKRITQGQAESVPLQGSKTLNSLFNQSPVKVKVVPPTQKLTQLAQEPNPDEKQVQAALDAASADSIAFVVDSQPIMLWDGKLHKLQNMQELQTLVRQLEQAHNRLTDMVDQLRNSASDLQFSVEPVTQDLEMAYEMVIRDSSGQQLGTLQVNPNGMTLKNSRTGVSLEMNNPQNLNKAIQRLK